MIENWTRTLAAQFIGFTLAALLIAQAITFVISWNEHSKALDAAAKSEFFSRTRTITRLVNDAVPSSRQQVLTASETGDSRFWISDRGPASAEKWRLQAVDQFSRPLENYVDLVQFFEGGMAVPQIPKEKTWRLQTAARNGRHHSRSCGRFRNRSSISILTELADTA
jgi:hypothetical protein